MRSILSRDIMLTSLNNIILSRDNIDLIWGQYYQHYVVHTMRSILSRDIMLFTLWQIVTWHNVVHTSRDIMLFTIWGQHYHVTLCCSHYEVILSRDICCSHYEVNIITWLCCFHYEVNIITWHYVVHHMRSNIITWHYVVHTMRSILSRDLHIGQYYHVITHMTILSRHYVIYIITWHMLFTLWGQYYHVTLCCSLWGQYYHVTSYVVNIITWHYVVHTMIILSRDIMLFTLWGEQYYHVTLCCSHYEVNIITWHYVVHNMR